VNKKLRRQRVLYSVWKTCGSRESQGPALWVVNQQAITDYYIVCTRETQPTTRNLCTVNQLAILIRWQLVLTLAAF
jgi:hypothetical protein